MHFLKHCEKIILLLDPKPFLRLFLRPAIALLLTPVILANIEKNNPAVFSQEFQIPTEQAEKFLPEKSAFRGWIPEGAASHYNRDSLYGYIDGGAEIFLQYDFTHLTQAVFLRDFQGAAQEIIIEIYLMASALDAFGIFSINRSGGEQISPKINAINWISPSQINFFKDRYFVNVLGFDCVSEELEAFASMVADKIPGTSLVHRLFDRFPNEERIRGSEKYIKGPLSAVGESVLLQAEFWGFNQRTKAYSCRYHPYNSRAILLKFEVKPESIDRNVEALFKKFLEDVETTGSEIKGKNAVGRFFFFNHSGKEAGLILGEESLEAARSRLDKLLGLKGIQTAEKKR